MASNHKKLVAGIIIFFLLLVAAGTIFFRLQKFKKTPLLNGQPITIEVAATPESRYQGLSDRASLCPRCGMLFLFPTSAQQTFVMRRMHFPLDIVWINKNSIVKIDSKLPPESQEPYTLYPSPGEVDAVLEINAAAAEMYGLTVGQKISL